MVKYVNGDLLTTDADVICHQVNLQGVMGGGLALAIARKFPNVEADYKAYKPKKLGHVCTSRVKGAYVVANCFSQTEDFCTDYDALWACLERVRGVMDSLHYKRVAIPYKYGCGIAHGDWDTVLEIFEKAFVGYEVLVYIKG